MRKLLPALVLLLLIPSVAHAQKKSTGIEISPAYMEVVIGKQEKTDVTITLTNHTQKEITLDLYPLDFSQKDEHGAIGFYGLDNSYSYSLASFLSFSTKQLIIPAGASKEVTVTVLNREDLSPGGHYAAVVANQKDETGNLDDATQVTPSLASLLLIHKEGGERFNISLKDTSWPGGFFQFAYNKFFTLRLQNEGNIHLIPYGRVEIKDMFGRLVMDGIINPESSIILPESRHIINVVMANRERSLPISFNTITISGHDSLNKVTYSYKDVFLYVHPFVPIGLVIVIIVIIFLLRRKR